MTFAVLHITSHHTTHHTTPHHTTPHITPHHTSHHTTPHHTTPHITPHTTPHHTTHHTTPHITPHHTTHHTTPHTTPHHTTPHHTTHHVLLSSLLLIVDCHITASKHTVLVHTTQAPCTYIRTLYMAHEEYCTDYNKWLGVPTIAKLHTYIMNISSLRTTSLHREGTYIHPLHFWIRYVRTYVQAQVYSKKAKHSYINKCIHTYSHEQVSLQEFCSTWHNTVGAMCVHTTCEDTSELAVSTTHVLYVCVHM